MLDWDYMKVASRPNDFAFTDQYLYEIKWDGIRCLAEIRGGVNTFRRQKILSTMLFLAKRINRVAHRGSDGLKALCFRNDLSHSFIEFSRSNK